MITAKQLKHTGLIKTATGHNETGQAIAWQTEFDARFGIDKQAADAVDQPNNTGNKQTLSLFTRYDVRLQNGQTLFIFGASFSISQLDNVEFANRRFNFTATEL